MDTCTEKIIGDLERECPVPRVGTAKEDLDKELWVMCHANQSSPKTATWLDLQMNWTNVSPEDTGMNDVDCDCMLLSQLSHGMHNMVRTTSSAEKLKSGIERAKRKHSAEGSKNGTRMDEIRHDSRKKFVDKWK